MNLRQVLKFGLVASDWPEGSHSSNFARPPGFRPTPHPGARRHGGCTFSGQNPPFDLSTSAIGFSSDLKNSIRKLIFHEKNDFFDEKYFRAEKIFFFHEKSIFGSIFQNRMKIRLRWSRGRMEHFYLQNRITKNPTYERGRSNTRRLTGE